MMFVTAHKRVTRRLPAARTCAAACVLAGLWLFFAPVAPALAHPHVWVTIKSELIYAPDGSITAIRHAWAFDDMFSTYALQGIEQKNKGGFTREELASLADTNVTSLKEYDYFNYARIDGKKRKDVFSDPVDYWLDYKDSVLTLHFTLPLKTPLRAQSLEIDIYDPEFFIDFSFADEDSPVTITNAPAQCALTTVRPNDVPAAVVSQRLNKSFQAAPTEAFAGMGSRFANKILVKCS
jgi:ABC-type uncharacterized transport system substrate-binding protein